MRGSILWRSASTVHDWNDGQFICSLLDQAAALRLIGPVTWCQFGIRGQRQQLALTAASDLFVLLREPAPGEPAQHYLEAGGEEPAPWSVKLSVAPADKAGQPTKPSFLWLFIAKSAVAAVGAEALAHLFRQVNSPDTTEYAFIHDYDHWLSFSDQYYQIPITIDPLFKGVFWLNFIGPGHLEEFEPGKLKRSPAIPVENPTGRGLYLQAYDDVLAANDVDHEFALLHLNKLFREALKSTSKWYSPLAVS